MRHFKSTLKLALGGVLLAAMATLAGCSEGRYTSYYGEEDYPGYFYGPYDNGYDNYAVYGDFDRDHHHHDHDRDGDWSRSRGSGVREFHSSAGRVGGGMGGAAHHR